MWFATDAGLSRYDGFEFKTYKCAEQMSASGSCIKEDALGRIWYENFDGRLFYVLKDSMHILPKETMFNYFPFSISEKYVANFQQHGIEIHNIGDLQLVKQIAFNQDEHFLISTAAVGDDLYFLKGNCVGYLDRNLNLNFTPLTFKNHDSYKLLFVSKKYVMMLSRENVDGQMYYFDRTLKKLQKLSIPEVKQIQGCDLIDDKFWIHSTQGTYVYDIDTPNIKPIVYLQGKSVSGMIKDRQQNYWFSTTSEGVFLIHNLQYHFYSTQDFSPSKIVKTSKGFLIGNRSCQFLIYDGASQIKRINSNNSFQSDLYYLYADTQNDNVFFSANGTNFIPKLDFSQSQKIYNALKEIASIDKNYYAFVANGFCALRKKNDFDTRYKSVWDSLFNVGFKTNDNQKEAQIKGIKGRGRAIAYDPIHKTIYTSNSEGFYSIHPNGFSELKFQNQAFFASKIFVHKNRVFALNTKGNLYEIKNEKDFVLLNNKLGIDEFDIKYARQFGKNLVLMTSKFIFQIELQNTQAHIIDINIAPANVNDLQLCDSTLLILHNSGIITCKTNFIENDSTETIFRINTVEVNGVSDFEYQNKTFGYKQNDINIRFSLLDFGSVQASSVYYSINGDVWKKLPADSRNLQFRSLASGDYVISFRLGNKELKDKISFSIDAPFWQKWWFVLLVVSVVGVIIYLYYTWQIRMLSKQIKLLNEKIELEQSLGKSILTSIKSQMNPHFFYNALNTIQAYIFTNDKRNASNYLAKFSKLTRMILEMSDQDYIKLAEEIQALTLYLELEKMRFDNDFNFEINIEQLLEVEMIKIPSMLIQPYVENAIKHGLLHKQGAKWVKLLFELQNKMLKVTITDNGIGRKKADELNKIKLDKHNSFATKANQKRLEILNNISKQKVVLNIADLMDSHEMPAGTEVTLFIPIGFQ